MIAAGVALDDAALRQRGLDLLAWLLEYETADGHLSPTPVAGRGADDPRPAFDQQPIEVATLADACARAAAVDAVRSGPRASWPPRPGSRATTTPDSSCGTRDRWRIRRSARRRGEPQPGRGVDAGGALDLAARSALLDCAAMTSVQAGLVTRSPQRLAADPSRVITRLFVPGQEGFEHQESRAGVVLARILALDEDEVRSRWTTSSPASTGVTATWSAPSAGTPANSPTAWIPTGQLSEARMLLLGATFTSEYAIEGAALCNPSIVAHPDQTGTAAGSLRFVMSVRGIGEGHRSSIGFRTGVVDAAGRVTIDDPAPFATVGAVDATLCSSRRCSAVSSPGCTTPARPPTTSSTRSATASPVPTWRSGSTGCRPT